MTRTYISVDVEADGPAPGLYSLVSVGAVALCSDKEEEWQSFYGEYAPLSGASWDSEALAVSGFSREQHRNFPDPSTFTEFVRWVETFKSPVFIADNNGFDWQFINYYSHRFALRNPFGFSSMNINSLYKGVEKDMFASFKHLRRTKHTHNPVDDARGNAEAFATIVNRYGIRTGRK